MNSYGRKKIIWQADRLSSVRGIIWLFVRFLAILLFEEPEGALQ